MIFGHENYTLCDTRNKKLKENFGKKSKFTKVSHNDSVDINSTRTKNKQEPNCYICGNDRKKYEKNSQCSHGFEYKEKNYDDFVFIANLDIMNNCDLRSMVDKKPRVSGYNSKWYPIMKTGITLTENVKIPIPVEKANLPVENIIETLENRTYNLGYSFIHCTKKKTKNFVGTHNKFGKLYRWFDTERNLTRGKNNCMIYSRKVHCIDGEFILEEGFKPLTNKSMGKCTSRSTKKYMGKLYDSFEKGKNIHKRPRT